MSRAKRGDTTEGGPGSPLRALAAAALILLAHICTAQAAPGHPQLPDPIAGFSLDHACGTAVDSEGDIYVSNAGESKVEVFDPSGGHLASIPNANEPCGLAVDSGGKLYVSEQATGKVVRYGPNVYPLSGAPIYGSAEPIDESGNARGIAVDPSDDSLYVAEGNRVAMFSSEGTPGVNERQRVRAPASGTYKLEFNGEETSSLSFDASHAQVAAALEALSTIGAGNVAVTQEQTEPANPRNHLVTFKGSLAGTNVEPLTCISGCFIATISDGNPGHIGEGEFTDATGVSSYTYQATANANKRRYISVADTGTDEIEILIGSLAKPPEDFIPGGVEALQTIDGSETPDGDLGLAATGAYLGVDQKNGHLFAYDAVHKVVNEFEARGHYFTQIENPGQFADAEPTAIAVDRSGGPSDGRLYVSAGASSGAKLLAFKPVAKPLRADLSGKPVSHQFNQACGAAVDSYGNLYLAGESEIKVYDPVGNELTTISDPGRPCSLAVDSEGNLYAADLGESGHPEQVKVVVFKPQSYPPGGGTTYTEDSTPIEAVPGLAAIAVNPANDRLFVAHINSAVIEYDSAKEGSGVLDSKFCGISGAAGIDVYGATGDVYIASGGAISVCNAGGTKVRARIDGSGTPQGPFSGLLGTPIAVDQANGHILVGEVTIRGVIEEFEASGAFVAEYGPFAKVNVNGKDIALDSSCSLQNPPLDETSTPTCEEFDPSNGNLYVAYRDDLTAFGPLSYGESPEAVTGTASNFEDGNATLNGTVDPRGSELEECTFEWGTTKEPYEHTEPCAETPAQIGDGIGAVPVHLNINGVDAEATRYHFRLSARNEFGPGVGADNIFGPPLITSKSAQPILYREATLRAGLDPSGLQTKYRFQYLADAAYQHNLEAGVDPFAGAQSTTTQTLSASSAPADVEAFLIDLAPGTEYHFRLLAESEAASVTGPEQTFRTLSLRPDLDCPNETLRLETSSSNLPDCRAYELVTPSDTRGARPGAETPGGLSMFNNWLVTPSGPLAGDSLAFFIEATLPGTEGNGRLDAFRSTRDVDADEDGVVDGWRSALFSPSFVQQGRLSSSTQQGVSADQLYSFWDFGTTGEPGAFLRGHYLRIPEGLPEPSPNCAVEAEPEGRFEWIGCGLLGTDHNAAGRFISPGATHVIFATETAESHTAVQLEPEAPSPPTGALYDRSPGGPTHVLSLPPEGASPATEAEFENDEPIFEGATGDGSSVAFSVNGALYLRRNNVETIEIAAAPASFAGISEHGQRVLYTDSANPDDAATLFAFDLGESEPTEIAADAKFVNVSADGSHVYYASGGDLFVWDGGASDFIAALDPNDLQGPGTKFPGTNSSDHVALDAWAPDCVNPGGRPGHALLGRATCPSRTTPDGKVLVFQSHADLIPPYEGQGHSEVYRYDTRDESLLCVSCDPSGAPATGEADLQTYETFPPAKASTLIPSVSEDGDEVFFQAETPLLPEDANSVLDVYEWQAQEAGGCTEPAGCLALISSGQGETPSYIYSMTPDGHDVFFSTVEKLVGFDIPGSPSLYDARVDGGFPNPREKEPCHGDACQGQGSIPPTLPSGTSTGPGDGNVEVGRRTCPKGKHRVNGRCVKRGHKHKHRHHGRAKAEERGQR